MDLKDIIFTKALFGGSSGEEVPEWDEEVIIEGESSNTGEWIGDGNTHLWIKIAAEGRMNVPLYFSQTVSEGVTIDWGDGSALQTLSGTGNRKTAHTYASIGEYCITLDVADGCTLGLGDNSSSNCVMGSSSNDGNRAYCNMLQKVEIGNGVTSIDNGSFSNCYSLANINIPNSVTSIGSQAFRSCYALANISIPNSVTSIGTYAFSGCNTLTSFAIPTGVTEISDNAFAYCYSLGSVNIPNGVTRIGLMAYAYCYSLVNVTISSSVTSIDTSGFARLTCLSKLRFEGTIPPTSNHSDNFSRLPTDCIISVPVGSLDAYKTATNYPDPNTYTYVEE